MPIPKEFYYQEAQGKEAYTREPSNHINVSRMLSGDPCFIKSSLARSSKQKKLILADWTAPFWKYYRVSAVEKALRMLMNKEFSIYILQHGKVVFLTQKNLSLYLEEENRRKINPISQDELLSFASTQQHISRDQMHVLDDYWVQCLIDENYSAPRQLSVYYFSKLGCEEKTKVIEVLRQAKPQLSTILRDEFHNGIIDESQDLIELKKEYPGLPIEVIPRHILFSTQESCKSQISLDNASEIFIYGIYLDSLSELLSKTSHLKDLSIFRCDDLNHAFTLSENSLNALESLELMMNSFSFNNLMLFLQATQTLKSLNLTQCFNLTDFCLVWNIRLDSLELLRCS